MIRSSIALILVALPALCAGQGNLVPNGDFEDMISCPTMSAQLWNTDYWISPTAGSPEYYHSCNQPLVFPPDTIQWPHMGVPWNAFGWQYGHSGEAYVGIYCFSAVQQNMREYIQIELLDSIVPSVRYLVNFYASVVDNGWYAVSTLGAYLSKEAISSDSHFRLDVEPQILNTGGNPLSDSSAWVLITDTFSSRYGGERYLTIGNFNTDETSDTMLYNPDGTAGFGYAYYYIDDVSVVAIDSIPSNVQEVVQSGRFKVYPNPSHGRFNVEYNMGQGERGEVRVSDLLGNVLLSQPLSSDTDSRHLDLSSGSPGIYLVDVIINGGQRYVEKVAIFGE